MRRWSLDVTLVLLALALLGCATATTSADVQVTVENETDIPVAVYVDGDWRGTDEPGATLVVPLGAGEPPIRVEVRSPTGAVLATLDAPPGPVDSLRGGERDAAISEAFAVPCGVVRIVVGERPVGWAPAPAEAVPTGPCP